MSFLKLDKIVLPSFFTKNEMHELISKTPDMLSMREEMETIAQHCKDVADQVFNDSKFDGTDEANAVIAYSYDLETMADQIEYLSQVLDLGELMLKDSLYVWRVPRDGKGKVRWEEKIEPPVMEKYSHYRHTIFTRETTQPQPNSEEEDLPWDPDFLLYDENCLELKKRLTVRSLADRTVGEIEDLDKNTFKSTLELLRELYDKHSVALSAEGIGIPGILEFFEQENIEKFYRTQAGIESFCPN